MGKSYTTKNKVLIMDFLKKNKDFGFSVSDLYSHLIKNNSNINLATVYRNLDKLLQDGSLIRYRTAEDDGYMYQYVDMKKECHEHLHMQCRQCGKIIHLECDFMSEIAAHLNEYHGFEIECKSSILKGLCSECKSSI